MRLTAILKQHMDGDAHKALALAVGAFPTKMDSQPRALPVAAAAVASTTPTFPCGCPVNRNLNDPIPSTCTDPVQHAEYVLAQKRLPRAQAPYPSVLGAAPFQQPGVTNTNDPTHENVAVVEFECADEAACRALADKLKAYDATVAEITIDGAPLDAPPVVETAPAIAPPAPAQPPEPTASVQ